MARRRDGYIQYTDIAKNENPDFERVISKCADSLYNKGHKLNVCPLINGIVVAAWTFITAITSALTGFGLNQSTSLDLHSSSLNTTNVNSYRLSLDALVKSEMNNTQSNAHIDAGVSTALSAIGTLIATIFTILLVYYKTTYNKERTELIEHVVLGLGSNFFKHVTKTEPNATRKVFTMLELDYESK